MWKSRAQPDRLNLDTKDELEVTGYAADNRRWWLTAAATVLSAGLLLIPLTWRPSLRLTLTHRRCPLSQATTLLLRDIHHQEWEAAVVREETDSPDHHVYFVNRKIKYVWDEATCTFTKIRQEDHAATFNTLRHGAGGLTEEEATRRLALYGENYLNIDILSLWQLLVQQAVNPFYLFQAFCVVVWMAQGNFLTGAGVLGLSLLTLSFFMYETRKQSQALREMVTSNSKTAVLRGGKRTSVSWRKVVPGDVVMVGDSGDRLEVDAVLLEGAVVVNEAMLTGESIPVTKVAVPGDSDTLFSPEDHKHHLVYSGTQVVQVRGALELPALVINTGFYTARGDLVRSILFPKPVHFTFFSDSLKLILVFLLLGIAAMSWSIYQWSHVAQAALKDTLFNSLDLVTFVVPPILPATLTAISVMAQRRLKRQKLYCLSSNYISPAGCVDTVCFDKTGTLTEEDLALAGVVPVTRGSLGDPEEDLSQLAPDNPLTRALATCHSLARVNDRLVGYPVDVIVFSGIDWTLHEPEKAVNPHYGMVTPVLVQPRVRTGMDPLQHEVAVLKTFPFQASEQRTTVLTRPRNSALFEVFIKGAPERIIKTCAPETVPEMVGAAVEWYSRQGVRVLAVAARTLREDVTWKQVEAAKREELECGASFLGLLLLQNQLKPQTPSVLATLAQANINTVMVTGDSLLTALTVARLSGLVVAGQQIIVVRAVMEASSARAARHLAVYYHNADHHTDLHDQRKLESVRGANYALATDGQSFELLQESQDKTVYYRLLHRGKVFARMKPEHKVSVVETLQDLGHQVAMCGDGCNDCGALKVANVGISLSSSEASVAAPFTSKTADISCVPALLTEGRATLVSSFAAFKFNVAACFGSLICVIYNFTINAEPSDVQYLVMDIALATIPAITLGLTGAPRHLTPEHPPRRLLSPLPVVSLLLFLGLQAFVYWAVLAYLRLQPWFEPFVYESSKEPIPCYENTTLMLTCYYFIVIAAVIFSHGAPYRKHLYTNYIMVVYLVVAITFCIFINFYTGDWLVHLLNFTVIPEPGFAGVLFCGACISFVLCFMIERLFLHGVVFNWVLPRIRAVCGPHPLYAKLEFELRGMKEWPKLSEAPQLGSQLDLKAAVNTLSMGDMHEDEADAWEEDDECDMTLLGRRPTRKFKASVKYISPKTDPSSHQHPASDQWAVAGGQYSSLSPQSAGYREPYDMVHGGGDEPVFKFNHSVRHQIMKGTSGNFNTFRSGAARQTAADRGGAQPYEVIPLQDQQPHDIYSTIQEEYREPYIAAGTRDNSGGGWQAGEGGGRTEAGSVTVGPVIEEEEEGRPRGEHPDKDDYYDIPKPPRPVAPKTPVRQAPLPPQASTAPPPSPPPPPSDLSLIHTPSMLLPPPHSAVVRISVDDDWEDEESNC